MAIFSRLLRGRTLNCLLRHTDAAGLVCNLTAGVKSVGQGRSGRRLKYGSVPRACRAHPDKCSVSKVVTRMGAQFFEAVRDALHVVADGEGFELW